MTQFLGGKPTQVSYFKAVATLAIFYSHWQLDKLITVLLRKLKGLATCHKMFNSVNILQRCLRNIVAEPALDFICCVLL